MEIILGIVVAAVVGLAALLLVGLYNRLVRQRNRVEAAWSQIDVQLRRRYDLIPNLVETVRGYASHEREALEAVTKARQVAIDTRGVEAQARAENMLTQTLRSLFAVAEAYPDLKASQNFLSLQEELSGTEGRIAFARQFYNDQVLHYDNSLESFPTNVVAGLFHFEPRAYFETEAEARATPRVDFAAR